MSQTGSAPSRGNRPLVAGLLLAAGLAAAVVGAVVILRGRPRPPDGDRPRSPEEQLAAGRQLYATHCAACHGEKGDGNGPAARFLYPRPRDFGEGKFRLVGNTSPIPSDQELLHVITRGMPGSAMFPFGHLGEEDRLALVAQVRDLIRANTEDLLRRQAGDGTVDRELLAELTRPGDPLPVPAEWPAAGPDSVARGHALYTKLCSGCHGATGKGDGAQEQRDDKGVPIRPRDFTRGIFKGGREREQLYARIRRGMPGTPMPASDLPDAEVGDMINFIHSLSDPAAQSRVEHRRSLVVAKRSATPLPDEVPEELWRPAPAAAVVVSPLWWREYAEPDLRVQALHDGQTLALCLSWADASRNGAATRPEEFEDMAAVQLFQGGAEPFLGMGPHAQAGPLGRAGPAVDLWLWRAGWQHPAARADSILDDYPFDSAAYPRLPREEKDLFLTARAAGNPNASPDPGRGAGSLAARGFGSTTFRPQASQRVTARSVWKDGRWTVVLRRPLAVGPEDGYALEPGGRCSVAFALWDGAAGDRNGQKLVSVWHDLKIE